MNTDFVQYCATVKNQVEMSYVLGISCIVVTVLMIFVEWLRTPAFIILDLLFGIPFLLLLSSIRGRFKSINPDRLDVRYTALFKSFRRLVYSLNRAIVIVAIISAICTAFYLFHRSQDNAHFQELLTEAAEMRHEYSELLPPVIAERMKDMDYVEDVKVTASMLLTHNSLGDYTWNEKVRITLYVDDAFDKLSDNKQYAYLCEEESKGHDVIRETIRTCLPRYEDLRGELFHIIEHDRRGFVRSDMDYDYEVQTSENHYQYGDSHAEDPTTDGLISCDRLISKALWDLGYTDQHAGGMGVGELDDYLSSHGFIRSTSMQDITDCSIMLVKHQGEDYFGHAYVALGFDFNTMTGDRYDTGCQSFIDQPQPLRGKGFWYRTDDLIVYNIPE